MSNPRLTNETLRETVRVLQANEGHHTKTAQELGIGRGSLANRLAQAEERGITPESLVGREEPFETKVLPGPRKGMVKRYLLTCAQNDTSVHAKAWKNLLAFSEHYGAQVLVSTFTYVKTKQQEKAEKAEGRNRNTKADNPRFYAEEIRPYINNKRLALTKNLVWCGELQIMPTARRPLTGFESYTFKASSVIPHPMIAMESVAAAPGDHTKFLYTTGTVTQRNYIQRREGFRAEHYHAYGALLVEVDDQGLFWCRHLIQGEDDRMYDLDVYAENGKIKSHDGVADVTWGDIHAARLDETVAAACWGPDANSMINVLRPDSQHLHDVLDMTVRSHHTRKDPWRMYEVHHHYQRGSLVEEFRRTAEVINSIHRDWCRTVVVNSNHDRHLDRYLAEIDWRQDLENAELALDLTKAILAAIRSKDEGFYLQEEVLRKAGADCDILFLREDQMDVILKDIEGGIQCGLHGDRGINGAAGGLTSFAQMSRKTNSADKHACGIRDHAYQAGTSSVLKMGYNKGPSSWTHSHIVTYPNGTRTLVGVWGGKWRA